MAYHELDPGDEEWLDRCPICENGYMVPTMGNWYQCSECGVEAQENECGILLFDSSVFNDEYDFDEDCEDDDDED